MSQPNSLTSSGEKPISIDKKLLESCIHCGLCLPACPTYLATGRESESPRGRIYLLTLASAGQLPVDERLVEHIDSCLGCMGCQTACPSGVHYEDILSSARSQLAPRRSDGQRKMLRYVFEKVLPDYKLLRQLGGLLRFWQGSPFKSFLKPISGFAAKLWEWQDLLPPVPEFKELPRQSWQAGTKTGEVQLFSGCIMDIFYNQVNHKSVNLLTKQKLVVGVPPQTCCGALASHSGEQDIARDLARKNIDYFDTVKGPIVVTAAGCGAMLKEYGKLLADDKEYATRAADFSERVVDITEQLAQGEFTSAARPLKRRVAYHAACHLAHVQKVRSAPQKLLEQLPGIELVPLEDAEHCCGSAGIYNLIHPELSQIILKSKMEKIADTKADLVVTTNPGCQLQLTHGAKEMSQQALTVSHLVELLDEAYSKSD